VYVNLTCRSGSHSVATLGTIVPNSALFVIHRPVGTTLAFSASFVNKLVRFYPIQHHLTITRYLSRFQTCQFVFRLFLDLTLLILCVGPIEHLIYCTA